MNLLDTVTLDDLDGDQLEIAEVIGMEAYRHLVKHFGGNSLRVYQEDTLIKGKRDKEILEQYTGYNIRQLSIKYGLSDRTIRNIVAPARTLEGQVSLFDES